MTPTQGLNGLPGRIAAVRRRLGLSWPGFAARVSVTRNVVSRWDGGRHRPRGETLDRIAKLGGVSVEWLLDGGPRERSAAGEDRQWKVAVEALRELWQAAAGGAAAVAGTGIAGEWAGLIGCRSGGNSGSSCSGICAAFPGLGADHIAALILARDCRTSMTASAQRPPALRRRSLWKCSHVRGFSGRNAAGYAPC
jgi:transcriptional regulator with XRE-family HTH domain